jgi:hypothetical protein
MFCRKEAAMQTVTTTNPDGIGPHGNPFLVTLTAATGEGLKD